MRFLAILTAAGLSLAMPALAHASSSAWHETQGGRVRLVTTGAPDAEGRLAGALEIQLKPGWKTYWRDPGDAGVPPSINVSNSPGFASAELAFPPPERFDDGYAKWAGYKHSVVFPVTLTLESPGYAFPLDADIFLGICETICIPVQSKLHVDPASDAENVDDAALIESAQLALPVPERPDFGLTILKGEPKQILVEAIVPGDPKSADLFIAGDRGYMLATPERLEKDGKLFFTVEIIAWPAGIPGSGGLYYTLVTDSGAVEGLLPFY